MANVGQLIDVPDGLGLPEATTFLHDGATVAHLFRTADLHEGDRVLVSAAGGSIGALLVPLAKAAGAQIVGAAHGERKLATVREWGADAAVDYSEPGWTHRVDMFDPGFDEEQVRADMRALLADAADKRVIPFVGQTFALEQARDAHVAIEGRRTIGKTVLLAP